MNDQKVIESYLNLDAVKEAMVINKIAEQIGRDKPKEPTAKERGVCRMDKTKRKTKRLKRKKRK